MAFENRDILFASLLGTRFGGSPDKFRLIQNELMKHVGPVVNILPFPPAPKVGEVKGEALENLWKADAPKAEEEQFFPLSFSVGDGNRYLFPYEPMVNISGKNEIVRRYIAKAKTESGVVLGGSVKERWTRGDFNITITGALYGAIETGNVEDCFPREDFEKLRDFMTAPKSISVFCEPLQLLGISQLVIEDFSFPFTKGENVQAYEIKCYSDFDYKLLLDIND